MSTHVSVSDDVQACLAIRRVVFIHEQGVSVEEEVDGLDPDATHLLAYRDGQAVGTARILFKGSDAKIGRVAVLKAARGSGLGAALIKAAIDVAKDTPDVSRVVLGAQTHALGFYEALGFSAFGPIYDDAGIPHRDMERVL